MKEYVMRRSRAAFEEEVAMIQDPEVMIHEHDCPVDDEHSCLSCWCPVDWRVFSFDVGYLLSFSKERHSTIGVLVSDVCGACTQKVCKSLWPSLMSVPVRG